MSSNRRSYLETLNSGRQRRPSSALEELNRSLEGFEQRLDRHMDEASEFLRAPSVHPDDAATRMHSENYRYVPPAPRQHVADRDPGFSRARDENLATMGRIAVDLKSLRDEVRYQMNQGMKREFDSLRREMERGTPNAPATDLSAEFERLAAMIKTVTGNSNDGVVSALRIELDQVRSALESLARVDAERDQRWQALEEKVATTSAAPAMESLHERLAEVGQTLSQLPDSLPLRSIEDRLRTLATAIDHFSRQERHGGEAYAAIEARLEEISRAIVATSVSLPQTPQDTAPFERIEARIGALAKQIEEVASVDAAREAVERLNVLTQRVEDIAQRADLPEKSVEHLARQLAIIADKIEQAPTPVDAEQIFQGIDERFEIMSRMIERQQGDASEQSNLLFRELERRLDEVSDRLDRGVAGAVGLDTKGMIDSIDERLDHFAKRIEAHDFGSLDGALARAVEERLSGIERKIETAAAPQFTGVDPEVIRNLESQVAAISAHLMRPAAVQESDVGPRLAGIERAILENREAVLDVARQAAEEVARSFSGSAAESAAVKGLAEDLKTLETLTRRSEERNSRTFEAIHDTLLKVVDRLAALDHGDAESVETFGKRDNVRMPAAAKLEIADTPSIMGLVDLPEQDDEPEQRGSAHVAEVDRSPAQAAAAAAVAALDAEDTEEEPVVAPHRKRSMFAGLAGLLSRKKKVEPVLAGSEQPVAEEAAPEISLDAPIDPKVANRPLEPGTGAPDLNAIMRRVRDEQPLDAPAESEAGKSDFIAAARRAAQAAAAEADMLKRQSDGDEAKAGNKFGELLKARRKPILMAAAAIMMALAGLQLSKSFFGNDPKVAANKQAQSAGDAAKVAAAKPATQPEAPKASEAPAATQEPAPVQAASTIPAPAEQPPAEAAASVAPSAPVDDAALPEDSEAAAMSEPAAVAAPQPAADEAQPAGVTAAAPAADETGASAASTDSALAVPPVADDVGPVALREAARAGDAKALFEIGSRYAEGRGLTTDMASAAKFYEKSAEFGFAPAQYRIGNFYEKGLGVERDVAKAKTWYQMAASQGNASAMHNLAVLFAMGADGTSDNDSAARWFTQAAELGVKDSQFNLGILTAKGVGVPQNLEESYKWFALVAKTGDRDASAKRDEIANALRPEQLERARAATELWRAKPVDPVANSVDIPDAWKSSPDTTASIDMDKAVRNIQALLVKAGYDAGTVDGKMGAKTRQAIAAFQKDNDLPATGEVDEKLVKVLLARK